MGCYWLLSLDHFHRFAVDIASQPMFTPPLSLAGREILACTRPISEMVHGIAVLLSGNTVLTLDNLNLSIEYQHNRLVDSRDMHRKGIFRFIGDGEDGIFEVHDWLLGLTFELLFDIHYYSPIIIECQ